MTPLIALQELVDGYHSLRPDLDRRSLGAYLVPGNAGLCSAAIVSRSSGQIGRATYAAGMSCERLVVREFDVLSDIHHSGSPAADSTPEPIGLLQLTPGRVAFYSHLAGKRARASDLVGNAVIRRSVVDWILSLHLSRKREATLDAGTMDACVGAPARQVLRRSGTDGSFGDALEQGLTMLADIAGEAVPFVTRHGNLEAGSVVMRPGRGGIGIVGWEFSHLDSLPLFDLFDLYIRSSQARYGLSMTEAVALCTRSNAAFAQEFRSQTAAYLDALGWHPARVDLWLLAYLISSCSARALANQRQWAPAESLGWVFALPHVLRLGDYLQRSVEPRLPTYHRASAYNGPRS